MGKLTEGVTYIYERDGDTVYARKAGETARKVIGIDFPTTKSVDWHDVMVVAKTNPALQTAIDHAIMLYRLTKETT